MKRNLNIEQRRNFARTIRRKVTNLIIKGNINESVAEISGKLLSRPSEVVGKKEK